jgi:hypothetical protein
MKPDVAAERILGMLDDRTVRDYVETASDEGKNRNSVTPVMMAPVAISGFSAVPVGGLIVIV